MRSKGLIDQVIQELQQSGEDFTHDDNAALASRTTTRVPKLGPGPPIDRAVLKRVVQAWGPQAGVALNVFTPDVSVRFDGDERRSRGEIGWSR